MAAMLRHSVPDTGAAPVDYRHEFVDFRFPTMTHSKVGEKINPLDFIAHTRDAPRLTPR